MSLRVRTSSMLAVLGRTTQASFAVPGGQSSASARTLRRHASTTPPSAGVSGHASTALLSASTTSPSLSAPTSMSASLPSTSPSPAPSATPQYDLTEAALEQLVPDGGDTSSSIIRTLADAFLSLHDRLPGSISYSALIVLLTLVLRSSITLPLTVWSRRRVRRVAELVVPRVKAWSARAKYALRAEYRKENRSYEDYVKELNARTKQQFKRLTKEYSCRPLPTMLLPPLIHLPVFITSTLVLREACNKSALAFSAAGGTSSTSDSVAGAALALAASHDALSPASPSSLATLAAESLAWCPSLAEVDPNTYLPAAVALTALANVEIQAALRARLASLQSEAASGDSAVVGTDSGRAAASLSATIGQQQQPSRPAPKRASIVRPARVVPAALQKRSVSSSAAHGFSPSNVVAMPLPSTSSTPSAMENSRTSSPPPPPFPSASAIRSKAITNVLRFGSLVFLPVAAYAPVAVNIYWLTSNCFSIVQNLVLGYRDRHRRI